MIILGIDPGIGRCGWAVIETSGNKLKPIDYGCIETSPKRTTEKRLEEIYFQISKTIKKHKPDVLAIEELFFGNNSKTAMVVGEARGVALLTSAQNNLDLAVYKPVEIKLALTGFGRAEKNQVGIMVKTILGLKEIPKLDDTADALAVAITHAFSYKMKAK